MTVPEAETVIARSVKLNDVCTEITVGHVGPMAQEYVPEGVPFLRSQNVQSFRIALSDVKFINPEFHKKLKKSALLPGDVVVVRTGYPGTAAVVPEGIGALHRADLVIIRTGPLLDDRYLMYVLNSRWGRQTVTGNLVGVAQQHFNIGAAREMRIALPSIATQRRVVDILSPYDDLIENSQRRITILEEMARSIYREWFEEFRFPGHEQVRMVPSEVGMVPERWVIRPFSEAVVGRPS